MVYCKENNGLGGAAKLNLVAAVGEAARESELRAEIVLEIG